MSLTQIPNNMMSFDGGALGFRNKIIGGDFTTNPWQRGTSFTAPAANAYLADRFFFSNSTSAVVNILKTADAPTAAESDIYTQHCLHVDVTTADTVVDAADTSAIQQRIEGYNAASFGFGQTGTRYVAISFWHKHTKTGIYCVSIVNAASNMSYVAEYTQTTTNTWEKAVLTIPVATTGTWDYANSYGLSLRFALCGGSTYQTTANTWAAGNYTTTANQVNALDSTSNDFKLALVQLEAGSVATPFEARPYGLELTLCQRYYSKGVNYASGTLYCGNSTSGSIYYARCTFPVTMRFMPSTITLTNSTSAGFPATVGSILGASLDGFVESRVCNTTGAGIFGSSYTAEAEL